MTRRQIISCDFCQRDCIPDTTTEALPFSYFDGFGGGFAIDCCGECAAKRTLADVTEMLLAKREAAQKGSSRS
jgi:hypothetical protein